MKHIFTSLFISLLVAPVFAQFDTTPYPWPTPAGGSSYFETPTGFYQANSNSTNGANFYVWSLVDINGDKKPDLVVTSDSSGNGEYNAAGAPCWHVYLNNGNGFNAQPVNWPTPHGGVVLGSDTEGYYATANLNEFDGQLWNLVDIDGDGKPDLVVTGYGSGGAGNVFNGINNPYWMVYLNTGTGFSTTATTWPIPANLFNNGYYVTDTVLQVVTTGSQTWRLKDINGDGKPDLIVTATNYGPAVKQFGLDTVPYWQVYINTGSGFETQPMQWNTPPVGHLNNNAGFDDIYNYNIGALTGAWDLVDMNNDGKPDMVLTDTGGAITNWVVYLNNGSGFATTPAAFALPPGGNIQDGGFFATNYNIYDIYGGSQNWSLYDINGDHLPDLVVTNTCCNTGGPGEFGLTGNAPYWTVFKNNGTSFDTAVIYWYTPTGGQIVTAVIQPGDTQIVNMGFNHIDYNAAASHDYQNSQSWSLVDMNGDGFADLVTESGFINPNEGSAEFGLPNQPHWQVYGNTGGTPIAGITTTVTDIPCKLYPNPNTGIFNLLFADNKTRTVEITNLTGQVILNTMPVTAQAQLNLQGYAPGVYFVIIKEQAAQKVLKVCIAD